MGGESTGSFKIENSKGIFKGDVVDVPFLKAPGFITFRSNDKNAYPDISSCKNLAIKAKSNTDYAGYRISFGTKRSSCGTDHTHAFGFKAPFSAWKNMSLTNIEIPLNQFSVCWNDATGAIITPCEENKDYCPTNDVL